MNVHFSYKVSKTPDLEKLINQQVEKLGRYLQVFRPDLVHLKGNHSVEEVRASVRHAREHLQRALPIEDPLTDKLVEYPQSA